MDLEEIHADTLKPPWWWLCSLELNSVCLSNSIQNTRICSTAKYCIARIVFVAWRRASSHSSVVTGSSSVSHRQCSSSFWISLLIAVAAGVLTESGCCWRPWWQTADLPGTIMLSDGTCGSCYNSIFCEKTNQILDPGVWMCSIAIVFLSGLSLRSADDLFCPFFPVHICKLIHKNIKWSCMFNLHYFSSFTPLNVMVRH